MTLFARVVEAGSFAAAAAGVGQTRAAVSRQVAGLEQRLGVQLLHRTTRRMRLTEVGREYYKHCAHIAELVESAELEVASLHSDPIGLLRIAAPVTFGRRYLAPLIAPFAQRFPQVRVDIALSDTTTNWISDGFDIGIQVTARPDPSLVAHELADSPMVVCASPAYFTRFGRPQDPAELIDHNCLVYSELETPRLWRFLPDETIRVDGNFSVNHGETLLSATLDGLGIAYMPTFIAGAYLADGQLEAALADRVRSNQRIFALHPRNRNLAPKVQAFLQYIVGAFQPEPPWRTGAIAGRSGASVGDSIARAEPS
jgi:DNA-binding transcriptional LysR family regulator